MNIQDQINSSPHKNCEEKLKACDEENGDKNANK